MIQLLEKLEEALNAYDSGKPIMSDYDYDCLVAKLRDIDPKHKFLQKISNQGGDYKHKTKMLSLDKVHSEDDFLKWKNNVKYFCSFKLDGIALSLHYILKDNFYYLHKAVTRGDGITGKDVTAIIHGLDIPMKILYKKEPYTSFEVRGEAIMDRSVFEKVNKDNNNDYMTPRNLVAGSFNNLKDLDILSKRSIKFVAYNLIADFVYNNINEDNKKNITFSSNILSLRYYGFNIVPYIVTFDTDKTIQFIRDTENRREIIPYDIDGIVIQINNVYRYLEKGFTDHHPKGAIAYKFKPNISKAIINDVTWQLGRTGILTPVAEINPIMLNGVLIKRATLHNLTFMEEKNIKIGSTVEIQRSGDVIPKINANITSEDVDINLKQITLPVRCSKCEGDIIKNLSTSGQYNLYCSNINCKGKLELKILYWLNMTGCKGIGDKLIIKLVRRRFVSKIADLYKLEPKRLMMLENIKIKSATNICTAISETKSISVAQFIAGLGIEGVGLSIGEKISDYYKGSISDILKSNKSDLENIEGIGSILAGNIERYIQNNIDEIEELLSIVKIRETNISKEITKEREGITGLSFCISGNVSKGKAYYYDIIESYGGIVHSGVTKKLNVLISNETGTSKVVKAKEYGIKIISESDLNSLIIK